MKRERQKECARNYQSRKSRGRVREKRELLNLDENRLNYYADRIVFGAKARAKKKNLEFNIEKSWVIERLEKGVCEATGIKFEIFVAQQEETFHHPWAPSIDRINSARGYTKDNCQIVVWAYNMAKGPWPQPVFDSLLDAIFASRQHSHA